MNIVYIESRIIDGKHFSNEAQLLNEWFEHLN